MGIIKKLKGGELAGWSQNVDTDVFPITSTGAVFNEDNLSLDLILAALDTRVSNAADAASSSATATNYLWAFIAASSQEEASSKLDRSEEKDVPTNYMTSADVDVDAGQMLYMTNARKLGDTYLYWSDYYVWTTPILIGSGETTTTGADGNGYNYIYCRTTDSTAPTLPSSITVSRIEGLSSGTGISVGGVVSSAKTNVWYDHPLGVEASVPYEWVAISYGNNTSGWSAYTNEVLWSKYGLDGRDGDGVEYIYKLVQPNELVKDWTTIADTITGRIGERGAVNYTVNIFEVESNENYLLDDFIPDGWHDNPLTMTSLYPELYVSVRKRQWVESEQDSRWRMFGTPTIWSLKNVTGFSISLDNDAVILDDNTLAVGMATLSKCGVHIYKEGVEITTNSDSYKIIIKPTPSDGLDDIVRISTVTSLTNNKVTLGDYVNTGFWDDTNNAYLVSDRLYNNTKIMFSIIPATTLVVGSYSITYTVEIYDATTNTLLDTLVKELSIQIVDISNGVSYGLLVSPNSILVGRESSTNPYTFCDTNLISVQVISCSGDEANYNILKLKTDIEGSLYIQITPYKDSTVVSSEYVTYIDGEDTTIMTYQLEDAGNNVSYYKVDLHYVHNGTHYLVDTETVDFNFKGDNGASTYSFTMSNDTAILDELTVDDASIRTATQNKFTVFAGTTDITSDCTFTCSDSELPRGLSLEIKDNGAALTTNPDIKNLLDEGTYNYTVQATYYETVVAQKTFTFIVKDITADGTVFKLNITNDSWTYDGDSATLVSDEDSEISVSAITNGSASDKNFTFRLLSELTNSGLEVVYPSTLGGLLNESSRTIEPSATYRANGYDLILYYEGVRVDSEHINCIKNGKNGINGTGSYLVTLDNDSATLDDNTIDADSIKIVSETNISFAIGTTDYTNNTDVSYSVVSYSIPSLLVIKAKNAVTINRGDLLSGNSFYLAPNGTITGITKGSYKITIGVNYQNTLVATKVFTFTVADLNAEGIVYKLVIGNDTWNYDGDTEKVETSTGESVLTVVLIEKGNPTSVLFYVRNSVGLVSAVGSKLFEVVYDPSLSITDSSSIGYSKKVTPYSTYNSNGFTFNLYYNGTKVDSEKIDCRKNGEKGDPGDVTAVEGALGLAAAILVPRGPWATNTTYRYNTDDSGSTKADVRYIDIVSYGADSYICVVHHSTAGVSTFSDDAANWQRMTSLGSIVTRTVLADAITTNSLNATDVVITKADDRSAVVAGMTSADPSDTANDLGVVSTLLDPTNNGGIRIWAGSTSGLNIATAPFRVYLDGTVKIGTDTTNLAIFNSDGTGQLAGGLINWKADGTLEVKTGISHVGYWGINDDGLYYGDISTWATSGTTAKKAMLSPDTFRMLQTSTDDNGTNISIVSFGYLADPSRTTDFSTVGYLAKQELSYSYDNSFAPLLRLYSTTRFGWGVALKTQGAIVSSGGPITEQGSFIELADAPASNAMNTLNGSVFCVVNTTGSTLAVRPPNCTWIQHILGIGTSGKGIYRIKFSIYKDNTGTVTMGTPLDGTALYHDNSLISSGDFTLRSGYDYELEYILYGATAYWTLHSTDY